MTEEEQQAATLRKIKQLEREQFVQDTQQARDAIELRIIEAQALLEEKEPISLIFYRNGDSVGVLDSTNQALCRDVLERILAEDREKLKQLDQ